MGGCWLFRELGRIKGATRQRQAAGLELKLELELPYMLYGTEPNAAVLQKELS